MNTLNTLAEPWEVRIPRRFYKDDLESKDPDFYYKE
jgi:hypothetical protein